MKLHVFCVFTFWGPKGHFLGWEYGSKTVFGSTHVVQQLLFSVFSSILFFLTKFWGPNGLILGFKNCFGFTHVVEKHLFFYVFFNSNF